MTTEMSPDTANTALLLNAEIDRRVGEALIKLIGHLGSITATDKLDDFNSGDNYNRSALMIETIAEAMAQSVMVEGTWLHENIKLIIRGEVQKMAEES
mgnify:CR=1 FL=1